MAMSTYLRADESEKGGMTILEFLEFAHVVEKNLKRGDIDEKDLLLGRVGFSAEVRTLSIKGKDQDKGVWNTP